MNRRFTTIGRAVALFATTILLVGFTSGETARFYILDVGQGDAILVTSPEGKNLLVDAGPSGRIVKQLRTYGISAIDLAVISHHNLDHYGGMDDVINSFEVRNLLMTNSPYTTLRFRALLRVIRDRDIRVINPTAEARTITLGSVTVRVFPQRQTYSNNENNNCVGLRVEHGNVSLLLTGDSEKSQRSWWLANIDPALYANSTILKVAHHGSGNGLDQAWLNAVNPALAVISVGRSNRYGHPNAHPLQLLERANVQLLRTDQSGTISIESDGKSWWLLDSATSQRGPPHLVKSLASGSPAQNLPLVAVNSLRETDTKPTEEALTHWLNLNTKVRHNSKCGWYKKTQRGRMCRADEGRACGRCGG